MRHARHCTVLMLAFALGACGHGGTPDDKGDAGASQTSAQAQVPSSPAAPSVAAATPPDAATSATRPLQVSDLDAYAKGVQKEIEMRQAASDRVAKARAAKDQVAEVSALAELTSVDVTNAGAEAAGVDRARYDIISNRVNKVLAALDMQAMMAKMGTPAQGQARLPDPYAGLDPDVAAALKSRADELGKLRTQNLTVLTRAANG